MLYRLSFEPQKYSKYNILYFSLRIEPRLSELLFFNFLDIRMFHSIGSSASNWKTFFIAFYYSDWILRYLCNKMKARIKKALLYLYLYYFKHCNLICVISATFTRKWLNTIQDLTISGYKFLKFQNYLKLYYNFYYKSFIYYKSIFITSQYWFLLNFKII